MRPKGDSRREATRLRSHKEFAITLVSHDSLGEPGTNTLAAWRSLRQRPMALRPGFATGLPFHALECCLVALKTYVRFVVGQMIVFRKIGEIKHRLNETAHLPVSRQIARTRHEFLRRNAI